jgi:hypothetical protein
MLLPCPLWHPIDCIVPFVCFRLVSCTSFPNTKKLELKARCVADLSVVAELSMWWFSCPCGGSVVHVVRSVIRVAAELSVWCSDIRVVARLCVVFLPLRCMCVAPTPCNYSLRPHPLFNDHARNFLRSLQLIISSLLVDVVDDVFAGGLSRAESGHSGTVPNWVKPWAPDCAVGGQGCDRAHTAPAGRRHYDHWSYTQGVSVPALFALF